MTHHQGASPTSAGTARAPQARTVRTRGEPKPIDSRMSCTSRGAAAIAAIATATVKKKASPLTSVPSRLARNQTCSRKLRPTARAPLRSSSQTGTGLNGLRRKASSAAVTYTGSSSGARRRAHPKALAAWSKSRLFIRRSASRTRTAPYSGRLRTPRSRARSAEELQLLLRLLDFADLEVFLPRKPDRLKIATADSTDLGYPLPGRNDRGAGLVIEHFPGARGIVQEFVGDHRPGRRGADEQNGEDRRKSPPRATQPSPPLNAGNT